MPLPLALMAAGGAASLLGSMFTKKAEKRTQTSRDAILADLVNNVQRPQFDSRMAATRAGDATQRGISQQALDAELATRSRGLGDILSTSGAGFDSEMATRDTGSRGQTDIALGNIGANRDVRVRNLALSEAERARQEGFQGQADTAAAGYKATLGAPQEATDRAAAVANRDAGVDATVSGPSGDPSFDGVNPIVKAIFASEISKNLNTAKARAKAGNAVTGYRDALITSGRRNVNFNDVLSILDAKAGLSASALPSELAVGDVQRTNAGAAANANSNILDAFTGGTIDATRGHTGATLDAKSQYYGDVSGADNTMYGRNSDAEKMKTDALLNASSDFESGKQATAGYRAANTNYTSPLGSLLSQAGSAMLSKAGGSILGSLSNAPLRNPVVLPRTPYIPTFSPKTMIPDLVVRR